jgi:hypothetical protein
MASRQKPWNFFYPRRAPRKLNLTSRDPSFWNLSRLEILIRAIWLVSGDAHDRKGTGAWQWQRRLLLG